jgi:hypothetical protein
MLCTSWLQMRYLPGLLVVIEASTGRQMMMRMGVGRCLSRQQA